MATGLASWSTTAATNATADSAANWAEGMAPAAVNDSARGMMSSGAKFRDDISGGLTTGGTSTAYTVTTNQVFASLTALDKRLLTIVPHATSGAAPTLAVDGLAAHAINSSTGVAIPTGALVVGTPYEVIYFNGATEFILLGAVLGAAGITSSSQFTAGVVDTAALATNGVTPLKLATSAVSLAGGMMNGTLTGLVGASALTIALVTLAGTNASATDIVYVPFRDVTAGTGDYTVRTVTGALSLVISSGSTMGFVTATPGRLWILAIDNGGTVELAAVNCLSGTNIYPLQGFGIVTTVAEGGGGGADSAHVVYSTTQRTSKPYTVLGYMTWEAGGTITAGIWSAVPTRIQLLDPTVSLPGREMQCQENFSSAKVNDTTHVPIDDTLPLVTEGTQAFTQAITPSSSANLLRITSTANVGMAGGTGSIVYSIFQDAANPVLASGIGGGTSANDIGQISVKWSMKAGTLSSTTFTTRWGADSLSSTLNGNNNARILGGAFASFLSVSEVMA